MATIAWFASAVATLIGVTVGAVAGYFGGWVDEIAMRAAELFQTIPNLIFVLTIVVILGSTLENIVIAIGIVSWTPIARMTRAEFLALPGDPRDANSWAQLQHGGKVGTGPLGLARLMRMMTDEMVALAEAIRQCANDFGADVELAAEYGVSEAVPLLSQGVFVAAY